MTAEYVRKDLNAQSIPAATTKIERMAEIWKCPDASVTAQPSSLGLGGGMTRASKIPISSPPTWPQTSMGTHRLMEKPRIRLSKMKGSIPRPKARFQCGGTASRCRYPATSMAPEIPKIAPEAPAEAFDVTVIESAL